jgi:hypothetical protein
MAATHRNILSLLVLSPITPKKGRLMKVTLLLVLAVLASLILIPGCGGAFAPATVHASTTPDCTPEYFFDIPQSSQNTPGGGVIEGPHTIWMATPACVITVPVDQSYTTKFPHKVQLLTVQMGSNTGSIFEWDQVVTVTDPSGNVLLAQQQQYDKHQDTKGNIQEHYSYSSPITIPAGSTIRITRRSEPETSCLKGGAFGDRVDCFTGGSAQLQD